MSNLINIQFMTEEAVETLRINSELVSKKIMDNPNSNIWLADVLPKNIYVEKQYKINDFELKIDPEGKYENVDFENSVILYEHLQHLPKYILSDERFWAWINFEKGYCAAVQAMKISSKTTFEDHWLFSKSKRRSIFFGVLSRCYYRVALTVDNESQNKYELSKFAIEKVERFRNLSWRTISSQKHVVIATLRAEKRILDEYDIKEKSAYFTELTKNISQLGSIKFIDVMQTTEIENYVYEKYKDMIQNDIENNTT